MADNEDAVDRLLSMIAPWTWVYRYVQPAAHGCLKYRKFRGDMHQYVKVST